MLMLSYVCFCGTGYLFSQDIVMTMERYGNEVAESVIRKAKKLCQDYPQVLDFSLYFEFLYSIGCFLCYFLILLSCHKSDRILCHF